MNEIVGFIENFFNQYGVKSFAIVILTIIIVNLIKRPIINKAKRYAEKNNCDKSIVTCYITYLVILVAFLVNFGFMMFECGFNIVKLDWSVYAYSSLSYATLSIAIFEGIKKQIEAYASKKTKYSNDNQNVESEASTNKNKDNISKVL